MFETETSMRTRPRDVVRMLAALRHSAHCRRLRAASAAQAARDLANEEAAPDVAEEDEREDERADPATGTERRRSGVH
jgi:hypothetical protein